MAKDDKKSTVTKKKKDTAPKKKTTAPKARSESYQRAYSNAKSSFKETNEFLRGTGSSRRVKDARATAEKIAKTRSKK